MSSPQQPPPAGSYDPAQWTICANPTFGFQFHYPRGWVDVPGQRSIIYRPADARSFIASDGGKTQQIFSPAVTLTMMPRGKTAGQTPAEVFAGFKSLMPTYFRDYAHRGEQTFRLASGQEAWEIVFDFLKGGRPFRALMAYVVLPNAIFIFDGSGLQTDFSTHEAVLRQSIRSLRVQ